MKNKIILSAELSSKGERENIWRTEELADCLNELGIDFKRCEGVYKGVSEASFMLDWSADTEEAVKELCSSFDQECYLVTDRNGGALLVYTDRTEYIGVMRASNVDPGTDAYTRVGDKYLYTIG